MVGRTYSILVRRRSSSSFICDDRTLLFVALFVAIVDPDESTIRSPEVSGAFCRRHGEVSEQLYRSEAMAARVEDRAGNAPRGE